MYIGELISIGTALCWTITVVSFEFAGKRVGSLSVNFIRLIMGFVFLGFILLAFGDGFIPLSMSNTAWSWLFLSGIIGLFIGDMFLFQAFVDVGGRISLLIMSMVPVISTILGYFFFEEVLSVLEFIGMAITLSAIAIAILLKKPKRERFHPHMVRGIMFAFIGAIAQAIGLVFSKIGMGEGSAFAATQIRIIAATIGFLLVLSWRKTWPDVGRATRNTSAMVFLAIGALFGPVLGVSSSLWALQYTEMGIATTIAQTNVIMIIPFSIMFFKEEVSYKEVLASVVAFMGVALLFI
ncbi:MAG: DMT family transporter [Candidatus Izemoplasma sp.]|nr:DMT family transporter [Candidatus Izemoplasma sp.]